MKIKPIVLLLLCGAAISGCVSNGKTDADKTNVVFWKLSESRGAFKIKEAPTDVWDHDLSGISLDVGVLELPANNENDFFIGAGFAYTSLYGPLVSMKTRFVNVYMEVDYKRYLFHYILGYNFKMGDKGAFMPQIKLNFMDYKGVSIKTTTTTALRTKSDTISSEKMDFLSLSDIQIEFPFVHYFDNGFWLGVNYCLCGSRTEFTEYKTTYQFFTKDQIGLIFGWGGYQPPIVLPPE